MNFNSKEGLVSAFQNGMTLEIPMKIEHFIASWLRSGIFVKNLAKTLGGYLGHQNLNFWGEKMLFLGDPGKK